MFSFSLPFFEMAGNTNANTTISSLSVISLLCSLLFFQLNIFQLLTLVIINFKLGYFEFHYMIIQCLFFLTSLPLNFYLQFCIFFIFQPFFIFLFFKITLKPFILNSLDPIPSPYMNIQFSCLT
jgi:hypothetical protein